MPKVFMDVEALDPGILMVQVHVHVQHVKIQLSSDFEQDLPLFVVEQAQDVEGAQGVGLLEPGEVQTVAYLGQNHWRAVIDHSEGG